MKLETPRKNCQWIIFLIIHWITGKKFSIMLVLVLLHLVVFMFWHWPSSVRILYAHMIVAKQSTISSVLPSRVRYSISSLWKFCLNACIKLTSTSWSLHLMYLYGSIFFLILPYNISQLQFYLPLLLPVFLNIFSLPTAFLFPFRK